MRPSTPESIQESLEIWNRWLNDPEKPLAREAREIVAELSEKKRLLESLLDELHAFGLGLTLKHKTQQRWGFILPDASEPGRFRWQEFGLDGFTGHHTHDSPAECLGDMVDCGYAHLDEGALARVSSTAQWRKGMEITCVVQAANSGLLTLEQAHTRISEISASYAKEAA